MPSSRPDGDAPLVVGVLYPPAWYGDRAGFGDAVAAIDAVDPRVEVLTETYVEPHDLRSAHGKPDADRDRDEAPALTDAQRAAFARVHVALAIDLPYDVRSVAPNLQWVQAVGAGTGQLQSAGLAEHGIRLTTAAGANAVAIAEFALARLLQVWKRLREIDDAQHRHHWEPLYGEQVAGATLGLLGLGAINSAVAARAKAFGLRVVATRRSATPGATVPDVDELFPPSDLHTMLGQCGAVIAAVPETAETTGLFDAAASPPCPPARASATSAAGRSWTSRRSSTRCSEAISAPRRSTVASREPLPADDPLGTHREPVSLAPLGGGARRPLRQPARAVRGQPRPLPGGGAAAQRGRHAPGVLGARHGDTEPLGYRPHGPATKVRRAGCSVEDAAAYRTR